MISCLKPKKREQAAGDTTLVPFLTLKSERDNADLCHGRGGQEPSDAAGALPVVDMSRQGTFLFYLPRLLKPKINTYLQ